MHDDLACPVVASVVTPDPTPSMPPAPPRPVEVPPPIDDPRPPGAPAPVGEPPRPPGPIDTRQ